MSVIDSLRSAAAEYPQARVVALADMSSRMILTTVGTENPTQEHLDGLYREASVSFGDPLAALAVEAFGEPAAALVITPADVRLFVRSYDGGDDALCCICDHGIDLASFVTRIRGTLDKISAGS